MGGLPTKLTKTRNKTLMMATLERRRASQEFAIAFMEAQHIMRELTYDEKIRLGQTKKRLNQTIQDLKAWRLIYPILAVLLFSGCGATHPGCTAGQRLEFVESVGGCDFAGTCRVTLFGPRTALSNYPSAQAHNCVWNIEGGTQ